jgi:hypothetical protein
MKDLNAMFSKTMFGFNFFVAAVRSAKLVIFSKKKRK